MKRLWAPWRMAYILKARVPGCFLCDSIQGKADQKNLILRRGHTCALIMNRYPYNNGHLMVAPYRHVSNLPALREAEQLEMMQLASSACVALKKTLRPQGFNLGLNIGQAAGAGLKDHIHLHIVPRWPGDTNFMPVLAGVKVIPQSLQSLWRQLSQALS
ncbi:MAG: HIT domain-containing protein [Lentisphaerae bacterium]|nr:HIT domain-containing protein [Lentisphaerota bacterium]